MKLSTGTTSMIQLFVVKRLATSANDLMLAKMRWIQEIKHHGHNVALHSHTVKDVALDL